MSVSTKPASSSTNSQGGEAINLYELVLLLNYERASTDPRFRHSKLREVTTNNYKTIYAPFPEWNNCQVPKLGLVLEKPKPAIEKQSHEPDVPSNMLPASHSPYFATLSKIPPKELETYYWRMHNHDGCFDSILSFQHFVNLLPGNANFRVRSVDGGVRDFVTPAEVTLLEMDLIGPRSMTMACVSDGKKATTYVTGSEQCSPHAVLAFFNGQETTVLDMACMQFGDVGRGFKGKGLFVLEPEEQYELRLRTIAASNTFDNARVSNGIRPHTAPNNARLQEVARRVLNRWNNREQMPWCGYCGAPPEPPEDLKRCSSCKKARYCSVEHQKGAWSFHKHFCQPEKAGDN